MMPHILAGPTGHLCLFGIDNIAEHQNTMNHNKHLKQGGVGQSVSPSKGLEIGSKTWDKWRESSSRRKQRAKGKSEEVTETETAERKKIRGDTKR